MQVPFEVIIIIVHIQLLYITLKFIFQIGLPICTSVKLNINWKLELFLYKYSYGNIRKSMILGGIGVICLKSLKIRI